ncbi:MAG: tRNA (adenosine(37)-N6)-threonylcarbamoyltransferase complex ATPase subunit type 1 TsaE [Spirochaetota bacterium]|nr:tRNA (adenosine(37)-N6)-threonylcarbamoyltransferase complex ATPase subunit type 1 TsaE [Spirochaetota bacterium]
MSSTPYHIANTNDFIPIILDIINQKYPKTVVLQGDLGAGKTSFVRSFINQLQDNTIVSSPTFTLMNIYHIHNLTIHHFDLYRLTSVEEVLEWGFEEFVTECDFAFVEWAERAWELIPSPYTLINLKHGESETERTLNISIIT